MFHSDRDRDPLREDAWGQDRREHPEEPLWWRDMFPHRSFVPLHPALADRPEVEDARRDVEKDG